MAAILALICFILAALKVDKFPVDLVALGLAFVALHLITGLWPIRRG